MHIEKAKLHPRKQAQGRNLKVKVSWKVTAAGRMNCLKKEGKWGLAHTHFSPNRIWENMFSSCGRHQADRNILCPWNSSSLPHPVSTTHILQATCTASETICATHLAQFTSTRTTQRDNASSPCDGLSFSHASYHWGLFPSCHLYLSCSQHRCVTPVPGYCTPGMAAALHSGVSPCL